MRRADARLLALFWAASGLVPDVAFAGPAAFDVVVDDSRAPKASYAFHVRARIIDADGTERVSELVEWRQDGRVRVESEGARHLADCTTRKGWSAQGKKVVEDREIWKHICGITPSPLQRSEIEVEGGVTRLADGTRLVVVPDAGFERWIRLDRDNVIMAVSYRPFSEGRGPKGWAVVDWIERCPLPRQLLVPDNLAVRAEFRCAAGYRETLADPMLAEGFRLSRWNDEDRIGAIFEEGFGDDDISERLEQALQEVERAAGADSIAYAEALIWGGLGWYERDERQRSIPYFQKAYALYERLVAEEHPLRTLALNTLADATATSRQWFGAAEASRQFRAIHRGRLAGNGPDSPVTIMSLAQLTQRRIEHAELDPSSPEWPEIVAELQRAHDLLVRTQGEDWRDVNPLRDLLVAMYSEAKQFDRALALLDAVEKVELAVDPVKLLGGPDLDAIRLDILERAGRTREAAELREKMRIDEADPEGEHELTPTA